MQKTALMVMAFFAMVSGLSAQVVRLELFPRQRPAIDIFRPVAQPDTLPGDAYDAEIEFDEWGFPVEVMPADTTEAPYGSDEWIERIDPYYIAGEPIAKWNFAPVIYDDYIGTDTLTAIPDHGWLPDPGAVYGWFDNLDYNTRLVRQLKRHYIYEALAPVDYNVNWLPEPPKHYHAFVDPITTQLTIKETLPPVSASQATDMTLDIEHRHWLSTFNASLQFSQAYVSPNWYQGGNNNLNMIMSIFYNIKLNEAFHKNVMFDTTVQYKLGFNSAPDDSLRSYSISEDLLQVTSKFGLRAAKRWYYSLNLSFKTQMLNNYASNTRTLQAAFLSPGELNLGVGMTYNYENPKKTFNFNASISPLSWNMKTCISRRMNETSFGIREGRNSVSEYGSSAELTMAWKLAYNINYRSRLFAFTDYDYFQGDWEHTLSFDINRYLSTQLYVHMRYDTTTPRNEENGRWHKFQIKEILSFGLSYSFKTK